MCTKYKIQSKILLHPQYKTSRDKANNILKTSSLNKLFLQYMVL